MSLHRKSHTIDRRIILLIQFGCGVALVLAWYLLPPGRQAMMLSAATGQYELPQSVSLPQTPERILPMYNDPGIVSDEQLTAVLTRLLPRFDKTQMRPNHIEHAIRIWGQHIDFRNEGLLSGPQMMAFLTDSAAYIQSWGADVPPLLEPAAAGVSVRWGPDLATSVHHDHLLTSLTEAGVTLESPVFTNRRQLQFRNLLNQALMDFRPDERETEWSVMAFGFWLAPAGVTSWQNGQGREISFNLLAERLMRNHRKHGVCHGTHRIYSLVVLLRLDQQYGNSLMSNDVHCRVHRFLSEARDLLTASQSAHGWWPGNWFEGGEPAVNTSSEESKKSRVIATGHHLEWLAIAPPDLHPERHRIRQAAAWAIRDVLETPQSVIDENYTFYSHVANALALWRGTTPGRFWTDQVPVSSDHSDFPRVSSGSAE